MQTNTLNDVGSNGGREKIGIHFSVTIRIAALLKHDWKSILSCWLMVHDESRLRKTKFQ